MLFPRELSNSKFEIETRATKIIRLALLNKCLNEYRLQKTLEILRNKNKANTSVKHVQRVQTILNI